jgi:hypothetical protein
VAEGEAPVERVDVGVTLRDKAVRVAVGVLLLVLDKLGDGIGRQPAEKYACKLHTAGSSMPSTQQSQHKTQQF